MSVEYKISSNAPHTIIVEGEGSLMPFTQFMGGKIIETFQGELCEIPFTQENALKLRNFLKGKDYDIPEREQKVLAHLADNPTSLTDKNLNWQIKLTELKNKPAPKGLNKIKTEWDLIHYLPLRYLDKTNPQSIDQLVVGEWAVVSGEVVNIEVNYSKNFIKFVVSDIKGNRISAAFFRQMWLAKKYRQGDTVILYGNYSEYVNHKQQRYPTITNPKIEPILMEQLHTGLGMLPIYPQKSQNKSWQLKMAQEKLVNNVVWIEDPVPVRVLKKYGLVSRTDAYKKIHFPNTPTDVEEARRRIAFDEFVRLQVFLRESKKVNENFKGAAKLSTGWAARFVESLPFSFTNAQDRVVKEIIEDLGDLKPMQRLLQGDVGSGKALPLSSSVLTVNGFKRMSDIRVGDNVITPSGGTVPVSHYFPQGVRPIYCLYFDDGTTVEADWDHLWVVNKKVSTTETTRVMVTTGQMVDGGVCDRSGNSVYSISHPDVKQIRENFPHINVPSDLEGENKKIVHIVYSHNEEAACIKLDNEEGLFITNNFTVTHNTEISSVATLVAAESGYQVAVLAPTDILATQLFERLTKTFRKTGITEEQLTIGLFSGRVLGKARTKMLEQISDGSMNVIVGTHALLQKNVVFHNLGLAVIDEQHKFGSEQRSVLRNVNSDGVTPDMLTMSATPIPRTTAQVMYGDMDISVVDELPAERIPIHTEWHSTPDLAWVKIREEVEKGNQAYVVASLVEDSEKIENVESATATYVDLQNRVFPDLKVGLLHGRLSREEKNLIINQFYAQEIQVLVATTVVEVGVNVPSATVMTILNANRFGIASLHQIRGRVGRSNLKSYCYLIGEATLPEAEERLQALVVSNDGFWLAEKDLEIRGEGTLFGQLQSGDNDLYVGNLKEHKDLLEVAKLVAEQAKSSVLLNEEVKMLYEGKKIRN